MGITFNVIVCTGQFVAMFTSGTGSMEDTGVCNAYISHSTRTLRSLLKEQVCNTIKSLISFLCCFQKILLPYHKRVKVSINLPLNGLKSLELYIWHLDHTRHYIYLPLLTSIGFDPLPLLTLFQLCLLCPTYQLFDI